MAIIEKFNIRRFKGAKNVTIDLNEKNTSPVSTLVGLNESGKTTILEALSFFTTEDDSASTLFQGPYSKSNVSDIIPIELKPGFTGTIEVTAYIRLDDTDHEAITAIGKKFDIDIDPESIPKLTSLTTEYSFKNSIFEKRMHLYAVTLKTKTGRQKSYRPYVRPGDISKPDVWLNTVHYIRDSIPKIVYFPTFIIDFPSHIYLREHEQETAVNRCYRNVINEILHSIKSDYSVKEQIIDRIDSFRKENKGSGWLSLFLLSHEKRLIDSVIQVIADTIKSEIIGGWSKIFQRQTEAKSILLDWSIDVTRDNSPYISFYISDGAGRYSLSERSLGFRWFFCFLLFTAFRKQRNEKALFLFDEPAANLHARAQTELLKHFSRIILSGNEIMFSTHSHYMINPRWLSGAYIVENASIDYEEVDPLGLNVKPTEIVATRYRDFAAQSATRTSYYQPILESLKYFIPELVGGGPYVLLEGVSDFYVFKCYQEKFDTEGDYTFMPGVGAGASGPVLSYFLAKGERFLIILDDDKAGNSAAKRYREEWFQSNVTIKTLGDISSSLSGKKLENLLDEHTLAFIKQEMKLQTNPGKKEIGLFFSELFATKKNSEVFASLTTAKNISEVISAIKDTFSIG